MKSFLPGPLRSRLAHGASYLRGRRINAAYALHYRDARSAYRVHRGEAPRRAGQLRQIGVEILAPTGASGVIDRPHDYGALVRAIGDAARARFARSEGLTFFPRLPDGPVPERTADIAAVTSGDVIIMRLADPATLPGVVELSRAIGGELERRIFASFAVVDRVFVYRSPVSRRQPQASWLWHYDNYPREILKVMIYLSDVTTSSAPFEYLRHRETERPLQGRPLAPGYGTGRFDADAVRRFAARGYEPCQVTGPAGTMLIFDTNVVHRATLAERAHRDVLVLQVRPASVPGYGIVDERWSGSFQHTGFNPDPADVRLEPG